MQKGFLRLAFGDARDAGAAEAADNIKAFVDMPLQDTYESRELETALRATADPVFKAKVMPC